MTKFLSILLSVINFTLPLPSFEIPEPTPEPVYYAETVAEGQDGTDVSLSDLY